MCGVRDYDATALTHAIHDLVDELREDHRDDLPIEDETLQLVIMALGDALFGAPLTRVLGLPRDRARVLAYAGLAAGAAKKR